MKPVYFVNISKSSQEPGHTRWIWDTLDEAINCIEIQGYKKISENLWELRSAMDGRVIRCASISTQLL